MDNENSNIYKEKLAIAIEIMAEEYMENAYEFAGMEVPYQKAVTYVTGQIEDRYRWKKENENLAPNSDTDCSDSNDTYY